MSILLPGLSINNNTQSSKISVNVATTIDLDSIGNGTWIYANPVLTAGTIGTSTIDGVVLSDGDTVLVKNQASGVQNGIYTVSDASAGTTTKLTRMYDMTTGTSANSIMTWIQSGTTYAGFGFICSSLPGSDVIGTDSLTFNVLVLENHTQTLTNKTITGTTNTVSANSFKTTGSDVAIDGSAPPSTGQVLQATSATTATWQASPNTILTTKGDLLTRDSSSLVRLPIGATGNILIVDPAQPDGFKWAAPTATASGVISTVAWDQKTIGTNGGFFYTGRWQTRDLNTLLDTEGGTESVPSASGITLNNNQLTLPIGTYFCISNATAYRVESHQARLVAVTTAEITDITTLAQASIGGGDYFWLFTQKKSYYFWFDTTGSTSDPNPSLLSDYPDIKVSVKVLISADITAADVASTLRTAINGTTDFTATVLSNVVTVTHVLKGEVPDALDGIVPKQTGFTFNVTTQGAVTVLGTGTSQLAKNTAQGSAGSSVIRTILDITGTTVVELQHRCTLSSITSDGYGLAAGFGVEVFSSIIFHKVS